jgi:release factor glutamine methyltransferase
MDLRTALLQGQKLLEDAQVTAPRLTAEVLLAHAVGQDRTWLYAHSDEELREVWWIHYGRYLHQRRQGKPTQHITGRQEFYGREFRVTSDVLIPRPETEHLIEAALEHAHGNVLDIGTGSGAIAATLALETKAHLSATDISFPALRIARENAARLAAAVNFIQCDLGSAFAGNAFDLVVSNPPYIPRNESLPPEVREHEPEIALYGGADGLDAYRRLIPEAVRLLRPGGWLIVELACDAGPAVEEMLKEYDWCEIRILPDLAGLPRVALSRRPTR